MADEQEVVTIDEPAPETPTEKPTEKELAENGATEADIALAKKHGMVTEEGEKEEGEKEEGEKEEDKKEEDKKEEDKKEEDKKEEIKKPQGHLNFENLDPDKEKVLTDVFGPGTDVRGLYFRMKAERRDRQKAQAKAKELEIRLQALEAGKAAPSKDIEIEYDEDGKPIDPLDRPVTLRLLKKQEEEAAKARLAAEDQERERAARANEAVLEQEEYAKSVYSDFEEVTTKAKELIQNPNLISGYDRAKLGRLFQDLQDAHSRADELGVDDYTAAHIAYEIGRLHPEHGKPSPKQTGSNDPKADGGLSPEKLKRIEKNAHKKPPSASVSAGGGKRTVAPEEVTAQMLVNMSSSARMSFRQKHPEIYKRLVHG